MFRVVQWKMSLSPTVRPHSVNETLPDETQNIFHVLNFRIQLN